MNLYNKGADYSADFRTRSRFAVALAAIVFLTPFAIGHILQHRLLMGVGSAIVVLLLSFVAWNDYKNKKYPYLSYFSLLIFFTVFLSFGIRELGLPILFWAYPVVLCFYIMFTERQAWAANLIFLTVIIPQGWMILEGSTAIRYMVTLLMVSVFSMIVVRVISRQQQQMHALAITDALTGLYNRTSLEATLRYVTEQSNDTGRSMTLLILDLDHFKVINDTLGHDAGDQVLKDVGNLLRKHIRRSDKVFRMGGEEFLVLLYEMDANNARRVSEQLRREIESMKIGEDMAITASIGIAAYQQGESWSDWIKRSDNNLYAAKSLGRNKVVD